MEELKTVLDVIQKAFTIAGILIGGTWAYYKFVKGRVFGTRLEPALSGKALLAEKVTYLVVTITLKNVGLSKVDVEPKGTALRVSTHKALSGLNESLEAEWRHVATFSIFANHRWIEPGETITEDRVIAVPGDNHFAFLLEMRVVSHRLSFETNKALTYDEGEKEDTSG